MPGFRRIGDGFEWKLSLPPAAVTALLTAVCVDQSGDGNSWQAIGHWLWGPKSWTIRFEGHGFRLSPLGHRDTFRMIFSPKIGKLIATKSGTCLRLECDATANQRLVIKILLGVSTAVFALVIACFVTASLPSHLTWLALTIRVAMPLWFLLGFTWLLPRSMERAPLNFFDDLFADFIVS
jgi:hypothetical protein